VAHQKPVPKPPGPGTIEIEIIPLHLMSCTPINPGNDRKQVPYSPPTRVDPPGVTPLELTLGPAVPNPFHGAATIVYHLPRTGWVRMELTSVTGSRVRTLLSGMREAGRGVVRLESDGLAAGVYFVRLIANGTMIRRRVVILR
jgi:hypothetical protein